MADESRSFYDLIELKIMWAAVDVRTAIVGLSQEGKWEGVLSIQFTHIKQMVVLKLYEP